MYATGLYSCSVSLWSSTAPNPKDDASAEMAVSRLGSYKAKTELELSDCFTSWKACSCVLSHAHLLLLFRRSRRDFVVSARLGANLLIWLAVPKNRRSSLTFFSLQIAEIFSGSGLIPEPSMTWSRNLTRLALKEHLSRFNVNRGV